MYNYKRLPKSYFSSLVLLCCQHELIVPRQSHFRNTSIASAPTILDSTSMELLASPLCIGSLSLLSPLFYFSFFYFQRIVHRHLFISWGGRGILAYWEHERLSLQRRMFIYTSDILFEVSPSPYSTWMSWKGLTKYRKVIRVGGTS